MNNRHYLETALESAIEKEDEKEALNLIDMIVENKDAALSSLNDDQQSFLLLAFIMNFQPIITKLKEIQQKDLASLIFQKDKDYNSCFEHAVLNKNDKEALNILTLAEKQMETEFLGSNDRGETLLHLAAQHGRTSVVEYILEKIKDRPDRNFFVNKKNKKGETALLLAAQRQKGKDEKNKNKEESEIFILLFKNGAIPSFSNSKSVVPIDHVGSLHPLSQIQFYVELNRIKEGQNHFFGFCKAKAPSQENWGALYKNLVEFRQLGERVAQFNLCFNQNDLRWLPLDIFSYISYLTAMLFLNKVNNHSQEIFQKQKDYYYGFMRGIHESKKEMIEVSEYLQETKEAQLNSMLNKDLTTISLYIGRLEKIHMECESYPEISPSAKTISKAILTLSFIFSMGITFATILHAASNDNRTTSVWSLLEFILGMIALLVFDTHLGASLIVSTRELSSKSMDDEYLIQKIYSLQKYLSIYYPPAAYKKVLNGINENVLEKLGAANLEEDKDEDLLTSNTDINILQTTIETETQLVQKARPIEEIIAGITALLIAFNQFREEMLTFNKPFLLFPRKNQDSVVVELTPQLEERQLLLGGG